MKKIIEYIRNQKNCKFNDLQFFNAKYIKADNFLKVTFSSIESDSYDQEKLSNLSQIVSNFIENRCSVEVTVKKRIINVDYCTLKLKELFLSNPLYQTIFDINEFTIIQKENTFNISLKADLTGFTELEKQKFEKAFLTSCEIEENLINFEYSAIKKDLSSVKERILEFEDDDIDEPINIKLSFDKVYLGKMESTSTALLPEHIVEPLKNVYVAGELSNITEYTKTSEDGKESKYYKFIISSLESKIDGVCFLKLASDLLSLKAGQKVVVLGDVEDFRGAYSIRVRGLSLCNFKFPEKKIKKANKFYKIVKPEPYIQKEQINFLDAQNKITSKYLLENTFVVFDLETTGLNFANCKIIEIGAAKIVKGEITEIFSTFVNPGEHIPDDATKKNNITDEMVKDAPTFNQVFPDFYKFIEGSVLVAHNINFDFPFISHHAKPLGYVMTNETQDTLLIAQKYLWQLKHFKLANICEFLGVSLVGAHRAVNDTVATAKCFVKLIENYQSKENV